MNDIVPLSEFDYINQVRVHADKVEDLQGAIQLIEYYMSMGKRSGIGLAITLHTIQSNWGKFDTDEPFEDFIHSVTGIATQTIRKYVRVVENVHKSQQIPDDLKDTLMSKPMEAQIAMSALANDEDVDKKVWERIVRADSTKEIKELIRIARGEQTSSNTRVTLQMKRDGTLLAWYQGNPYNIGWIDVSIRENSIGDRAITRLISSAGIQEE